MSIIFRQGGANDAEALADVYRDAVRTTGANFYNSAQIEIWAEYPASMGNFAEELSCGLVIIAEEAGAAVAFGQLDPRHRIAFLYCRGSHARRGIASKILRDLESAALAQRRRWLVTEASRASRELFLKFGFRISRREQVEKDGEIFERFRMRKRLAPRRKPPHP